MHEKNIFIICLIGLLLFSLSSCCTGAGIHDNGNGAYAVREHIGELGEKQTESAIASEQLNRTLESAREKSESLSNELTAIREGSEHLTQSITDGAGDVEALTAILQRIRARGRTADSGNADSN